MGLSEATNAIDEVYEIQGRYQRDKESIKSGSVADKISACKDIISLKGAFTKVTSELSKVLSNLSNLYEKLLSDSMKAKKGYKTVYEEVTKYILGHKVTYIKPVKVKTHYKGWEADKDVMSKINNTDSKIGW